MTFRPSYLTLLESGELERRARQAAEMLKDCHGCAWECGVDRTAGELGKCRTGFLAQVSSYSPHLGEEDPLRGWRGSGTIFFTHCNMKCRFCQNYDISQLGRGQEMDGIDLATIMLHLQKLGCHNINLVSPSHVVAPILEGLALAARVGLHLPLVYNTGGYDALETLKILDGVVDIYMPDMKYASPENAEKFSRIKEYPRINRAAVGEMHRQVGDLQLDENGIATRGLLVRHLILPNGLAGTREIVDFLAQEISPNTYLNLMDQYRPVYRADHFPELNRGITRQEYDAAVRMAVQAGIKRLDERRGGLFL
jgi:putative pyruvate formate lyase activating enzyme